MVEDAIFGGFVSKVINDLADISKDKIKNAVKNRNNKHQSLESQIYNVIVDVLNEITSNQYEKEQDKIYDVAESLLIGFKDSENDDAKIIGFNLSILLLDKNECKKFISLLYHEISKNEYCELYREILLLLVSQKDRYTPVERKQFNQKLDEIKEIIKDIKEEKNYFNINEQLKIKSRTQEYADKWNENMFLNNFNEWDENAGINIRLKDVYLESHLPHFIFNDNIKVSTDLKKFLSKYIVEKNENQMLLVLGQPGIGKSTLITWITANFVDSIDNILVYQFASDLENINWNNTNKEYDLSKEILRELDLKYNDLNEKILILDGFDEINVRNERDEILNQLYWKLIKSGSLKNFSLMITCRENYIQNLYKVKCNYITLQAWIEKQIKSFCAIYQKKTNKNISENTMKRVLKNKDIFGIPLILYMVLALNISIEEEGSVVDVYDQIFSLEGGIYDRCINNDSYASPHRIKQIKNQIHQISRELAIWIFENNSGEAYIPQSSYSEICKKIQKDIEYDSLIGNFFKLKHCEDIGDRLYFVHRSIYEYFVAETIYSSIENAMKKLSENSREELAGSIAIYLKKGEITETIGEYLKHKIIKLYNKLDNEKKEEFYQWWEDTIDKMMKVGMFYYTNENIRNYENIIFREMNCFINLIKILRAFASISKRKYIMKNSEQLERYIKYCCIVYEDAEKNKIDLSGLFLEGLNLSKINMNNIKLVDSCLRRTNLEEASLQRVDLRGANLAGANLAGANLAGADLRGADLTIADLQGANVTGEHFVKVDLMMVNLTGANLTKTIFDENQISHLEDKYDLQKTKVYIEKIDDIISYEEYCSKKKRRISKR